MLRAAALLLFALPLASAHVPAFDEAGASAAFAFRVDDPTKSWVFFDDLGPGDQHWFTFDLTSGQELYASLNLPAGEAGRPTLWILTPGGAGDGPAGTPPGWGGQRAANVDDLSIEPFTPVALRSVAEWRAPAPVTGTYFLVVEGAATYSLGLGARESFTVDEWLTVPVERIGIQHWAGVPWPLAILGEVVGLVAAVYLGRRWHLDAKRSVGIAGAGIIAGTALTTSTLAVVAAIQAGVSGAVVLPLVFALIAAAVGYAAFKAVMGSSPWWLHLAWAGAALVFWAGLLLGPAVLAASSAIRARSVPDTDE